MSHEDISMTNKLPSDLFINRWSEHPCVVVIAQSTSLLSTQCSVDIISRLDVLEIRVFFHDALRGEADRRHSGIFQDYDGVIRLKEANGHGASAVQQLNIPDGINPNCPVADLYCEGATGSFRYKGRAQELVLNAGCDEEGGAIDQFIEKLYEALRPAKNYVFYIGRMERDFVHAREAIRMAIEREAGLPCLTADCSESGFRTSIESVREQTRLLISGAYWIIADITLGPENPIHENPSRAHEIGMSIAMGHPLILISREPRRVPYYSLGDMQVAFWANEKELYRVVSEFIRPRRDQLGRLCLNNRLEEQLPRYKSKTATPGFEWNKDLSFTWEARRETLNK